MTGFRLGPQNCWTLRLFGRHGLFVKCILKDSFARQMVPSLPTPTMEETACADGRVSHWTHSWELLTSSNTAVTSFEILTVIRKRPLAVLPTASPTVSWVT